MVNPFNILISQLLKAYKLDDSANKLDDSRDVYTFSMKDNLDIHLIGKQQNYLNIVCFLDISLENLEKKKLCRLLSLNSFCLDHPVFSIGIHQGNKVVLSTRQLLRELDSVELFNLVEVFTERADSLQHWLNSDSGTSKKYACESDFIARPSPVRGVSTL
ncbi:MAG: CesT family type III secretion system chaperone [Exilibacterium sp.]